MSTETQSQELQKDIDDMIATGDPCEDIYNRNEQRLVTFSLGSNKHMEVLYHTVDDISSDNIAEVKIVKTGFERVELPLSEEEIESLADKGYF